MRTPAEGPPGGRLTRTYCPCPLCIPASLGDLPEPSPSRLSFHLPFCPPWSSFPPLSASLAALPPPVCLSLIKTLEGLRSCWGPPGPALLPSEAMRHEIPTGERVSPSEGSPPPAGTRGQAQSGDSGLRIPLLWLHGLVLTSYGACPFLAPLPCLTGAVIT